MIEQRVDNFEELENSAFTFWEILNIDSESKYEEVLEYAENLLDKLNAGNYKVEYLLRRVTDEIVKWEETNYPMKELTPVEYLEVLMEKHGHKQCDLTDIAVPSTISSILSGKRSLTLKQIKALAIKYNVPVDRFISLELVK